MYINPSAREWKSDYLIDPAILDFHKTLPDYGQTPLVCLPQTFSEGLEVGPVLIKDESHRFGLPAYKILGASWACYKTVCQGLDLPATVRLEEVRKAAETSNLHIYTATDGNWGRSVARMAKMLGVIAHVYVPKVMLETTRQKIRLEGGTVVVVEGEYDQAVKEAEQEAIETNGLLVEDTSWPGYHEIPQWVVDGYSTMMTEISEQAQELVGRGPDLIVCPVGAGSLAQAVLAHFKSTQPSAAVLTVESDKAACLQTSLESGKMTIVSTEDTIMCGMNCGTVSDLAWPYLRDGVDASVTVTDEEAGAAEDALHDMGIHIGPCGASTLAALLKVFKQGKGQIKITDNCVIVLLGTEGPRGSAFDTA